MKDTNASEEYQELNRMEFQSNGGEDLVLVLQVSWTRDLIRAEVLDKDGKNLCWTTRVVSTIDI